jgi:deazaflavin-dependent oxidoreductase (nitroreductase family)
MKEGAGTIGGPTPRGWLRVLLRVPILLYRMHIGWLLGHRFLLLTHVGRKSGTRHHTVLEVIAYASTTGTCIVASGWGEKAQWLKNIMANPDIEVTLGGHTHRARARRMSRNEAEQALRAYARRHPWAMKQVARLMLRRPFQGRDKDFALLVEQVPLVELQFMGIAP